VKDLADLYESEVILHMAVELPSVEPLLYPLMVSTDDAANLLERYRAHFPGLRVQISTSLGSAAATIVEVAERETVDLVAMTPHGRTGASRWAFGSVAEQAVRHCPCPLLVKRTGGFERQATE
jgi:nucleotide-binding universal stress UspA family protein